MLKLSRFYLHSYINIARDYVKLIQTYENAANELIEINDGEETEEFISIWLNDDKRKKFPQLSDIISDWNTWYRDVICA
jgi:hypothetical protein